MAHESERRDEIGTTDVKVENSKFHIKSIAYAAENLELGSTKLEVSPVEALGYMQGEVTTDRDVMEETGVDAYGNAYTAKIETSNAMVAEWLQWGSNRITPPNIRRGERVLLWQYAQEDKYYWSAMGLDDHLRRLETVTYAWSNTKDEETQKLDPSNSYYAEVNTHSKVVNFRTNMNDGEPHAYLIQLNTKDGCLTVTDDIGNTFGINSAVNQVWLENADKSYVILDRKSIHINAPEEINISAKSVNIKTQSNNIQSSNTDIKSNVNIQGSTATKGSLTNNGANVGSTHTHGGIMGGPGRTSTPG